jgi:hypothetical protein
MVVVLLDAGFAAKIHCKLARRVMYEHYRPCAEGESTLCA